MKDCFYAQLQIFPKNSQPTIIRIPVEGWTSWQSWLRINIHSRVSNFLRLYVRSPPGINNLQSYLCHFTGKALLVETHVGRVKWCLFYLHYLSHHIRRKTPFTMVFQYIFPTLHSRHQTIGLPDNLGPSAKNFFTLCHIYFNPISCHT